LTPDGLIYAMKLNEMPMYTSVFGLSSYGPFEERNEEHVDVSPHRIIPSRQLQGPSVYVGWT
jgi:hypothetical protein